MAEPEIGPQESPLSKMEIAVEQEIRRVLETLNIEAVGPADEVLLRAKLAGVNIIQQNFPENPQASGWYIYMRGKCILIIRVMVKGDEFKIVKSQPHDDAITRPVHERNIERGRTWN